ncbi:hypothetical protein LCGC14_1327500 [marine sediment metagenome]|uniref:Uncharacterized protein n=1 Tax=marine sediment metagenome TaxID=412755 RepID=A0A0F9MYG2_9ZZZZ
MATKKRLRALRGFNYPDAKSMALVQRVGGKTKLTREQRAQLQVVEVELGEWCDDLPDVVHAAALRRRLVEEVDVQIEGPKTRTTKKTAIKPGKDHK